MASRKANELSDRELEVMREFWDEGDCTAEEARRRLAQSGTKLAYVTVANLVRQLEEKGFLKRTNSKRPFVYTVKRSFEEVSSSLVGNLLKKVFDGSRQRLLVQVLGERKLTISERKFLRDLLNDQEQSK